MAIDDRHWQQGCAGPGCQQGSAGLGIVDPAIASDPAVYPDAATLARMYTPKPQTEEQDREITRIWTEIKAGG